MILLDTNVISELMKTKPDARVIGWLDAQPRSSIWTTAFTIFEIRFRFQSLVNGKRKDQLVKAFEVVLAKMLERRIALFDSEAALRAADLMAFRQRSGRTVDLRDTMIAGVALATKASLATGNTKHFEDLKISVINPWDS